MNREDIIARELVRIAKAIIAVDTVFVSVFSFEPPSGKPRFEGRNDYYDEAAALRDAKELIANGYDVVVWEKDTLIGFSKNFTTIAAMAKATGNINRLTRQRDRIIRL